MRPSSMTHIGIALEEDGRRTACAECDRVRHRALRSRAPGRGRAGGAEGHAIPDDAAHGEQVHRALGCNKRECDGIAMSDDGVGSTRPNMGYIEERTHPWSAGAATRPTR